jgi:branched-chain amino acid transport system substrate-binding protein
MRVMVLWASAALLTACFAPSVRADIPDSKIKVAIIDRAGPVLTHDTRSALIAAELAAEDFEAVNTDKPDVEIKELRDDQPDRDAEVVNGWLEHDHIDAVIDIAGTSAAAQVAHVVQAHHRLFIMADLGGPNLRKEAAGPNTIDWGIDPTALGNSLCDVLMARGGKSWFFISSRTPLPKALANDAARCVAAAGGSVTGRADHALGTRNLAPDLRKADGAGAQVIALADEGPEVVDAIGAAAQLGLPARRDMAALFVTSAQIDQAGLQAAQGFYVATPFYWDRNAATRNFTARYIRMSIGHMPSETEAIMYSAMIAYLHAARAVNSVDADKILAELRRKPIPDDMLGTITLRPDNVATHDIYVFRVKRPSESHQDWDLYAPVATVPGAQAFRPPPAVPAATPATATAATPAPPPPPAGASSEQPQQQQLADALASLPAPASPSAPVPPSQPGTATETAEQTLAEGLANPPAEQPAAQYRSPQAAGTTAATQVAAESPAEQQLAEGLANLPTMSATPQPDPAGASPVLALASPTIQDVQRALRARRLYQGDITGVAGPEMAGALRAFQRAAGLPATGQTDLATLQRLLEQEQGGTQAASPVIALDQRGIAAIERALRTQNFYHGPIDGQFGQATRAALRAFQSQAGLPATGETRLPTLARLLSPSAASAQR